MKHFERNTCSNKNAPFSAQFKSNPTGLPVYSILTCIKQDICSNSESFANNKSLIYTESEKKTR